MPSFAGNQSSASGSAVDLPHLLSSSSPSESSEESSESDDRGVTGRGVLGVASQSLPSVRQLSGAATGVFSGEGKGGTGGGLTFFTGVGTGAFAGLGLDGGFVGLASEVGVTGASGAGALEAAQPMLFGAAGKCLGVLPPRARQRGLAWSGTSVLWSVARRSYAVRSTKRATDAASVLLTLAHLKS